ncbi:PREDICTED: omega-hydroxypalmitate O-feruloyl transferase [Tarenaya hassleriana]|uniref:omega-hydroxypalmitate O-feruloyl transferase n=1 Tax=Tarenaya hassleriana TaxID=28532 RepID=UPI00053C42E6|nr:PREDICTED: omega-hydroxypalmitate O-feruloyl transferase [Tarenaya hassleriana]
MESLCQDLKFTVQETSLVFPSHGTKKTMFLSNVDQVLNFDVQTLHFFRPSKDFPPEIVSEMLKDGVGRAMESYEFVAGRLRTNPSSGRLEVECNGAGAGFVRARSECTLDELGDLVYPNPAFANLVTSRLENLPEDDQPICTFQITSFKCGGFVMGVSTNHAAFDGLSFRNFLGNLASLISNNSLSVTPCNDRRLLQARSPPQVTFTHHELVQIQDSTSQVFEATSQDLDIEILKLGSREIDKLKEKAGRGESSCVRITSFNVVTALIWKCKALSVPVGTDRDPRNEDLDEKESTILYAVDIRSRLNPPLPFSYTGNAVLTAYARAKRKELLREPFWRIVEKVEGGAKRMTDEYARSVIDWGEMHKGFPHGEVLVSSWWKLGFADVEFPWGRPKYSCPVVYHRKDIILFLPDIDPSSKGVNVLVALPPKEMEIFQALFQEFLA